MQTQSLCCPCGWPTGLSEHQGDAALLCGCGMAVGLAKVLGTQSLILSSPWPLSTWAQAEVQRGRWPGLFLMFYRLLHGLDSPKNEPQCCHPGPEEPLGLLGGERYWLDTKLLK